MLFSVFIAWCQPRPSFNGKIFELYLEDHIWRDKGNKRNRRENTGKYENETKQKSWEFGRGWGLERDIEIRRVGETQ